MAGDQIEKAALPIVRQIHLSFNTTQNLTVLGLFVHVPVRIFRQRFEQLWPDQLLNKLGQSRVSSKSLPENRSRIEGPTISLLTVYEEKFWVFFIQITCLVTRDFGSPHPPLGFLKARVIEPPKQFTFAVAHAETLQDEKKISTRFGGQNGVKTKIRPKNNRLSKSL